MKNPQNKVESRGPLFSADQMPSLGVYCLEGLLTESRSLQSWLGTLAKSLGDLGAVNWPPASLPFTDEGYAITQARRGQPWAYVPPDYLPREEARKLAFPSWEACVASLEKQAEEGKKAWAALGLEVPPLSSEHFAEMCKDLTLETYWDYGLTLGAVDPALAPLDGRHPVCYQVLRPLDWPRGWQILQHHLQNYVRRAKAQLTGCDQVAGGDRVLGCDQVAGGTQATLLSCLGDLEDLATSAREDSLTVLFFYEGRLLGLLVLPQADWAEFKAGEEERAFFFYFQRLVPPALLLREIHAQYDDFSRGVYLPKRVAYAEGLSAELAQRVQPGKEKDLSAYVSWREEKRKNRFIFQGDSNGRDPGSAYSAVPGPEVDQGERAQDEEIVITSIFDLVAASTNTEQGRAKEAEFLEQALEREKSCKNIQTLEEEEKVLWTWEKGVRELLEAVPGRGREDLLLYPAFTQSFIQHLAQDPGAFWPMAMQKDWEAQGLCKKLTKLPEGVEWGTMR